MLLPIPHLAPLGVGLTCAVGFDLWRRRIPNAVSVAVFVGGILVRALDGGLVASLSGLGASVLVTGVLFRPWRAGGVGGGDVKLAAAVGAWVGLEKLIWFALSTAVAGGLVALVCYFLRARVGPRGGSDQPHARRARRRPAAHSGAAARSHVGSLRARDRRRRGRRLLRRVIRRISGLGAARRSL